jgi:endonuclease-3
MSMAELSEVQRVGRILDALALAYPDVKPGLHFTNPFELLISTILSAQCTDRQVNRVTPALFLAYPDAKTMAKLSPDELVPFIRSCGFYAVKSKNIIETCKKLRDAFGGQVPRSVEELQTLPGVGRKTANVVASNAFGQDAIAVDTHVFRVSNRLGLANAGDVKKTEEQLMQAIPKDRWSIAHHWLINHGRNVCIARSPKCLECTLSAFCNYHLRDNAREVAT